jgi:hypothetical protein
MPQGNWLTDSIPVSATASSPASLRQFFLVAVPSCPAHAACCSDIPRTFRRCVAIVVSILNNGAN